VKNEKAGSKLFIHHSPLTVKNTAIQFSNIKSKKERLRFGSSNDPGVTAPRLSATGWKACRTSFDVRERERRSRCVK
jgi:hypothetical protein